MSAFSLEKIQVRYVIFETRFFVICCGYNWWIGKGLYHASRHHACNAGSAAQWWPLPVRDNGFWNKKVVLRAFTGVIENRYAGINPDSSFPKNRGGRKFGPAAGKRVGTREK